MKKSDLKKLLIKETENVNISMSKELLATPIQKHKNVTANKKTTLSILMPILASFACCVLILCLCLALIPYNDDTKSQTQLTSYILKINPEFCITTDQNDNVVNICSLNNDADDVLDNAVFDNIIGTDFSNCVSLIIDNVDESIFQNYGNKRIALYAINDNTSTTDEKLDMFGEIVRNSLDDKGYNNIQFDKYNMTLNFFQNKMGFKENYNNLNDMQYAIEHHDKFFDKNHQSSQK